MGKRQTALLQQLDEAKRWYGLGRAATCERLLAGLQNLEFADVESLIRFHDNLLFLRAFPQSERVAHFADGLLADVERQVKRFKDSPDAAQTLDDERVSGIAGTTVTNNWTFELARWLVARHAHRISAEWSLDERYWQMAMVLPSCIPLLADDSFVEVDTPYLDWIEASAGKRHSDIGWLLSRFAALPASPLKRTSLYDSLGINLHWDLSGSPASRTLARCPVSRIFVHNEPLLQRKQVSLHEEIASPPLPVRKLGRGEAQETLDIVRDALAVRYRELHGTTHGSPECMFEADAGRGVRFYLWSLLGEWRLPLRGYLAGITLKNGVPINYIEAIGMFEWLEVGFNTFYAYRAGETAWIYSKVLHLLHQLAGATCFSVYPYQIGQDNEEAIQSGAFWFYRKLGFRPGRPDLLALAVSEEKKMARDPQHRTSPRTLRRLAESHIFFEFGSTPKGRWDFFSTRNLGLAVQRKMAAEFDGDAEKTRRVTEGQLCKSLGVDLDAWNGCERWAFSNFALALSLVPGVARWSRDEKRALVAILRAKARPSETKYLRLQQRLGVLREAFLQVGSARPELTKRSP